MITIRLYQVDSVQEPSREVAVVVLGESRDRACILPDHVEPDAQFFLERVDSANEELSKGLIQILSRESVAVLRASESRMDAAVQIRGDYRSEEPYGTPTYWRTILGRLPKDAKLECDLRDYRHALETMDEAYEEKLIAEGRLMPAELPAPVPSHRLRWFAALAASFLMGSLFSLTMAQRRGPIRTEITIPVVELGLIAKPLDTGPLASRETVAPEVVVLNGQEFTVEPRVATARRHGWLFEIDKSEVALLTLLEHEKGILTARYNGRFNDITGHEFFVIVLADQEPPALGREHGPVHWLDQTELDQLQVAARQNADSVEQIIRIALNRAGLAAGSYDVRIQHVVHEPK